MDIKFEVHDTPSLAACRVADGIALHMSQTTSPVLGLATGGTPLPVYKNLVERTGRGELSFANIRTFNLDEYVGLSPDDHRSYHQYMRRELFDEVGLQRWQTHLPSGVADDCQAEAIRYEETIRSAGGITLQLLGIGTNGHIGFNEPGSKMDSITRVVDLAESTMTANARYFDSIDEVPRQAITMGIGTIRRAERILLLATGRSKAAVVAAAIRGPATDQNPASLLRGHDDVTFVLDRDAASMIA